ncbi:MAG: patatin-like phospholipase family protein [Bacteroidota bacterium]
MDYFKRLSLIFALFIAYLSGHSQDLDKRIMVLSGGGARGAWGGSLAMKLCRSYDYDVSIGTSTGSLIAPFILSEDSLSLEKAYTNVTQKQIFSVNPFKTRGKNKGQIKYFKLGLRIVFGNETAGKSKNLRKLIRKELDTAKYKLMIAKGEFIATVVEFESGRVHYQSSNDYMDNREQMLDWIWASANQPIFMSLYKTVNAQGDRQYWIDGGIRENVAVVKALEKAVEKIDNWEDPNTGKLASENGKKDIIEIDVIVNNSEDAVLTPFKARILPSLFRTIDIFSYDTRSNDVTIPGGILNEPTVRSEMNKMSQPISKVDDEPIDIVKMNFYYMNRKEFDEGANGFDKFPTSLLFDPERMKEMWRLGKLEKSVIKHDPLEISIDLARAIIDAQSELSEKLGTY